VGAAVLHGRLGGLVVAAVVSVADIVEVQSPTQTTWHNILLLFLLGGLIGLAVDLARGGMRRYEQVLAERERLRERERLARVVHDGVLQTLAFIHRRGDEIGGQGAELGALAADQERALRRLVSQDVLGPRLAASVEGEIRRDLRLLLGAHEGERVSVSLPGGPVPLEQKRAEELDAAVVAALDNVTRHAGDDARAWLLLEDHGDTVTVTVRDNGVGAEPQHLLSASERGRLGMSQSIVGRVRDLGGTTDVISRPGAGCRVVITVPREETA
jgi:signal transduction histidine kinase